MYLYLTTTGRVTGQSREVEIWFAEHGGHFYLVAERESANWVRNIQSQPQVKVRVGDTEFNAIARVVHRLLALLLARSAQAGLVQMSPTSGRIRSAGRAADRGLRRLGKAELSEAGKCLGNGRAALFERRSERGG
jgi:deazaflavin-dependent oxidoreductase (nitroreductase family)